MFQINIKSNIWLWWNPKVTIALLINPLEELISSSHSVLLLMLQQFVASCDCEEVDCRPCYSSFSQEEYSLQSHISVSRYLNAKILIFLLKGEVYNDKVLRVNKFTLPNRSNLNNAYYTSKEGLKQWKYTTLTCKSNLGRTMRNVW